MTTCIRHFSDAVNMIVVNALHYSITVMPSTHQKRDIQKVWEITSESLCIYHKIQRRPKQAHIFNPKSPSHLFFLIHQLVTLELYDLIAYYVFLKVSPGPQDEAHIATTVLGALFPDTCGPD